MKKVNYAYDVLYYETKEDICFCYALRIKRYRLKSRYPLVTVAVSRQPIINDFSELSPDYENLSTTVEERLRYSLPLSEMISFGRRLLCDTFFQPKLDMPFD